MFVCIKLYNIRKEFVGSKETAGKDVCSSSLLMVFFLCFLFQRFHFLGCQFVFPKAPDDGGVYHIPP